MAIYFGVKLDQESNVEKKDILLQIMEETQEGRSLVLEFKMAKIKGQMPDEDKKILNKAD